MKNILKIELSHEKIKEQTDFYAFLKEIRFIPMYGGYLNPNGNYEMIIKFPEGTIIQSFTDKIEKSIEGQLEAKTEKK